MTLDSSAPGSRFRTGRIVEPTTPTERLESLLGDGPQLYAVFEDLVRGAAGAGDAQAIAHLAGVMTRAEDPQRAYAAQRLAATVLVGAGGGGAAGQSARLRALDLAVDLLTSWLDEHPHEPELLVLLGRAAFELGDAKLARRVFEAVREMEPEHALAREQLRACRARLQAGPTTAASEQVAPSLARLRTAIRSIAERAPRLPERTISLCMIVKDEQELLPGCLAAVAPFVDQLVIVDTGSTDDTRDIAESFGATVVDFEWNGSFSDARNESLRHATGDWVLWLDADEHLVAGDGPRLRELARRTWVEGFQILETHFMGGEDGGATTTHAPMRLFRRRPEYRWHGTVHEQVAWALPSWLPERVQQGNVRVDHYGYLASVVDDRGKHARNLDLLMAQVETDRSAFTCFNIGTEHAALLAWGDARRWFEEALDLARRDAGWEEQQFAPLLVQRTAMARRMQGDQAGAIALVEEALAWWPDHTDLVFERALAHADLQQWAEVAEQARRALALGDAPARYVAVSGRGTFQARALLAKALREQGHFEGAREELEHAVAEAPHYLTAIVDLTDLLLARESGLTPAEASARIDELLGDRSSAIGANLQVAAAFHEAGAHDEADERYARVLDSNPTNGAALVARAELRLAQGRTEEAWELGMSVDALDPFAARGALSAFLAGAAMDEPERLAGPAGRIATSEVLPPTQRSMYVAWHALLDPSDDAVKVLVPHDAVAADSLFANLEALIKLEATDAFERLYPLTTQVVPDVRDRRLRLADLYLRNRFADMAGEELLACAEEFGADARVLVGLGKVATLKELWEDAEVFLAEALQADPSQADAARLLAVVRGRAAG